MEVSCVIFSVLSVVREMSTSVPCAVGGKVCGGLCLLGERRTVGGSQYEHCVAIGKEAVALADGFLVNVQQPPDGVAGCHWR